MKNGCFFILLFNFCFVFSQNRIIIEGKLLYNNVGAKNIHIFNKTSDKGTTTNNDGIFFIKIKENDELVFTATQFETVKKRITKNDILDKKLIIKLRHIVNKLETVTIKKHNLSGSLFDDRNKVPANFKIKNSYRVSLKDVNLDAPGEINTPKDRKIIDPLTTSETVQSVNFIKVYKLLTKGIRKRKKIKKAYEESLKLIPIKIREELGDDFFIEKLKMQRNQIEGFILFCNKKNIFSLYNNNKNIEMIEVLFAESKLYLKNISQ